VLDHVYANIGLAEFDERLDRIVAFEKSLSDDGALFVKFWMHLGKDAQKRRLKSLEKDPLLSWRVTEADWRHWRMYERFVTTAERTIMHTSTGPAPWHIVEGYDPRYRSITVAQASPHSCHAESFAEGHFAREQFLEALDERTQALQWHPRDQVVEH
jgi:polyphosphate kinase 2 (PPK2 family)